MTNPHKFWFGVDCKDEGADEHEKEVRRLLVEMDQCLRESEEEEAKEAEEEYDRMFEEEGHTREELHSIFQNFMKELKELEEEEDDDDDDEDED